MPKYETDDNPKIDFPIWLLGLPVPAINTAADLIHGLVPLASSDGEVAIPLFVDEDTAKKFLSIHGGTVAKDAVPKKAVNPKDLDSILHFAAEKMGAKYVFIWRSADRFSTSTVTSVRFAIAMQ
jgi:hypothetical protein